MDIKKLSTDFSPPFVSNYAGNRKTGVALGAPQSLLNEEAVSANVLSNFETKQREKVASIASAIKDGTYRQPSGRELAAAVIEGIGEVISMVGEQGERADNGR